MAVAWAALVVSLVSLIWQAATWWHREWRRVHVSAVLYMRQDQNARGGLAYWVGVRVTNRGRPNIVLRAAGVYWSDKTLGSGHTWAPAETTLESGASHLTPTQDAQNWWVQGPSERTYYVRGALIGWARLDSGRLVESKPGLVLEPVAPFPVELLDSVLYYRADGRLEGFLREWLGVKRDRLVETPSLRARFPGIVDASEAASPTT